MSKLHLPLMSLVAAIPAGFLTYLLVMAFLNHAEAMSTTLLGVAGLTVLLSAALTIMPIGALIFGPKGASKKKAKSKDVDSIDSTDEDDDLVPDSAAELSDEFGVDELDTEEDEFGTEEEDDLASGDDLEFGDSGEISAEFEDDEFSFEDDDYEFDDEEEEDK